MRIDETDVYMTDELGGYFVVAPRVVEGDLYYSCISHVRCFELAEIVEDTDNVFRFKDEKGRLHELRPVTVEEYERIKDEMGDGNPSYKTVDEIKAAARAAAY